MADPESSDYFERAEVRVSAADRESLLRFLGDLAEQVGPWVFAGYGGPLARLRHQAGNFVEGERAVDEVKQRWADGTDVARAVETLFEIAADPPEPPETERLADYWDADVCDLLWRLAQRDRRLVEASMARYAAHGRAGRIVRELEAWLSEDAP